MNLALGLDRAAETRSNFVVPQVDVGAAFRAKARAGGGADFVLRLAFKAFDLRVVVLVPKSLDLLAQRRIAGRRGGFDPFFLGRIRISCFGTEGAKCEPHWRHIVLLAAAYSICL